MTLHGVPLNPRPSNNQLSPKTPKQEFVEPSLEDGLYQAPIAHQVSSTITPALFMDLMTSFNVTAATHAQPDNIHSMLFLQSQALDSKCLDQPPHLCHSKKPHGPSGSM